MQGLGTHAELTFAQLESFDVTHSGDATLLSAFNWCNPFDHIFPFPDATVGEADRAHLWGLYSGIAVAAPVVPDAGESLGPVTGNEAGALGGYRPDRARRKKARILADDEEFMLMAKTALAEMLKNI